jgi:nitroimidazol reductase NimA-like FMN-containing flavoprotein (pyridoxamine 5'-phosphate oxidase superfamily)
VTAPAIDRLRRHRERGSDDRDHLDAIIDAALVGTLATVVDDEPWVVPVLVARDGDRLLVHGSTGAGALRQVAAGAKAAICVTHLDALVVAHTTFESSANYRSAVVRGRLEQLSGAEAEHALDVLSEHVLPGRLAEVRGTTPKERAATMALALPITEGGWTVKVRNAWSDEPDEPTDAWIGIVPVETRFGEPVTAPFSPTGHVPGSVTAIVGRS